MSQHDTKILSLRRNEVASLKVAIQDFIGNFEPVEITVPNILLINLHLREIMDKLEKEDDEL